MKSFIEIVTPGVSVVILLLLLMLMLLILYVMHLDQVLLFHYCRRIKKRAAKAKAKIIGSVNR